MRPWACLLTLGLLGCRPPASSPLERRVYDLWDLVGHDQAAMAAPTQRAKLVELADAAAGDGSWDAAVALQGARLVVDLATPDQHTRVTLLVAKLRSELRAVPRVRRLHDVRRLVALGAFLEPDGRPLERPGERLIGAVEPILRWHLGDGWSELDGGYLTVVAPADAQARVDRLLAALLAAPRGSPWAPPSFDPPLEARFRAD